MKSTVASSPGASTGVFALALQFALLRFGVEISAEEALAYVAVAMIVGNRVARIPFVARFLAPAE